MTTKKNLYDHLFNIDFRKYSEVLTRQKNFVLVFCLSAVLASLAFTYLFSEKYQAGITIYYRPLESSLMRMKDTSAFGAPAPAPPFKVIVQTLRDIIRSEAILRPVVESLRLDGKPEITYSSWYERWYHSVKDFVTEYSMKLWMILKYGRIIEGNPVSEAVAKLRKNMYIHATKDSYVYVITVKDNFPKRAADIIDSVGLGLVKWLSEQDQNPAEQRLNRLRVQLIEKENKISLFRDEKENLLKRNDVVSISEETSRGVKSLYDIEQSYIKLNAQMEEKQKKISGLDLEIKKKSYGYPNPDDLRRMESEKLFDEIELEGLTAKLESLRASLDNLKSRLRQMLPIQKKVEELNMKINAESREYIYLKDLYLESLAQATTTDSEVKIMHLAEIPTEPVQPIKIYHIGLTAILSLFFSTGLVYVLAFFNIRLFFSSDGVKGRGDS